MNDEGSVPTGRKSIWLSIGEINRLIQTCQGLVEMDDLDGRQRMEVEDVLSVLKTIRGSSSTTMVLVDAEIVRLIQALFIDCQN